jgi:precorrin-6B methylase 2
MKVTKPEIIGILFAKLKPEKSEMFADIGCGSGSISEFFAPHVRKVYAVDVDEKAVEKARKRLAQFSNVEVIWMDALKFLREFEYDVVFFGGTKGIEEALEIAAERAGKIAVNAARIEIAVKVMSKMKELGIFKEMLIVNISKSYELAGGMAFKNLNPVFVVVGKR